MVLLLGPPGGGKTTLLNALAGKLRSGGGLRVRGQPFCIIIFASTPPDDGIYHRVTSKLSRSANKDVFVCKTCGGTWSHHK